MADKIYRWVKASDDNFPKEFGTNHFRDSRTKYPITAGTAYTLAIRKDFDFEWLEKVEADQQEGFVIREFNSDKYYWCKCENCGWEDSSEFLEGCSPIGETGDHTDPICPICSCNRIEGDAELDVPDTYSGVHQIKIPIDLILRPYKKCLKSLDEALEKYRYPEINPNTP